MSIASVSIITLGLVSGMTMAQSLGLPETPAQIASDPKKLFVLMKYMKTKLGQYLYKDYNRKPREVNARNHMPRITTIFTSYPLFKKCTLTADQLIEKP